MIIKVKLFAVARDLVGNDVLEVDLPDGSNVVELKSAMVKNYPELAALIDHTAIAIDNEYASSEMKIAPNSDIACIPPVSGG